jgi:EmrB/QacA subfamily drug resistance transporter
MATALSATPLQLKLSVTSYLISLSIFIPISGYLADRYGTQIILLISIFLFGLSSFLCGMADTLSQLVCYRILQGAAGALLVPVGRLLMLKVFPKQELVKVYIFISMPLLLGPLIAPYLGGLFVTYFNWRFIFFINLPFALFTLLSTFYFVDNFKQKTNPFNWLSFFMLALFLASLTYFLDANHHEFLQQLMVAMVIIVSLIIYLKVEFSSSYKIINYALFKIRTYRLCFFSSVISRISLGARNFTLALYLQIALDISPLTSGTLISSMAIGYLFSRLFIKKYLQKMGFRKILIICNMGATIGTLLFCFINESNLFSYAIIIAVGFFTAVVLLLLNVLCFADIDQNDFASATSLNSTTQQLFVSVGVSFGAVCLYLLNMFYEPFSIKVFQIFFILLAVVTFLGHIAFIRLKPADGENLT